MTDSVTRLVSAASNSWVHVAIFRRLHDILLPHGQFLYAFLSAAFFTRHHEVRHYLVGDFPQYPRTSSGMVSQKTFLLFSKLWLFNFQQDLDLSLGGVKQDLLEAVSQPVAVAVPYVGNTCSERSHYSWLIILPYLVWCSNSSYYTFHFQITTGVFSPDWDLADALESDSRWGPEAGYRSIQHTLAASRGRGKRCHGVPVMPPFQSSNFLSLPQFFPWQNPTGNQLTLGM